MKLFIKSKKAVEQPTKPKEVEKAVLKGELPQPRECTFCGHTYTYPCDGKKDCPNRLWLETQGAKITKKK